MSLRNKNRKQPRQGVVLGEPLGATDPGSGLIWDPRKVARGSLRRTWDARLPVLSHVASGPERGTAETQAAESQLQGSASAVSHWDMCVTRPQMGKHAVACRKAPL